MIINKVTAAYFSPTDTTRKTVQAIAGGILPEIENLDLTRPEVRAEHYTFEADEMVVVGAPVYGGRIPLVSYEAIRHLHGKCTPVVIAAVYGNRDFDDALLEMRDLLSAQGFIPVAAGAFIGEHSFGNTVAAGRPDRIDLYKCADFGRQIYFWCKDVTVGQFALKVPGSYPYKTRGPQSGLVHEISADCIHCMHCVEVCPTAAISPKSPAIKDMSLCIKCQACAKKCPKGARIVPDNFVENMSKRLMEMCGEARKDAKLYFGR